VCVPISKVLFGSFSSKRKNSSNDGTTITCSANQCDIRAQAPKSAEVRGKKIQRSVSISVHMLVVKSVPQEYTRRNCGKRVGVESCLPVRQASVPISRRFLCHLFFSERMWGNQRASFVSFFGFLSLLRERHMTKKHHDRPIDKYLLINPSPQTEIPNHPDNFYHCKYCGMGRRPSRL
jgi:hypothetical protein